MELSRKAVLEGTEDRLPGLVVAEVRVLCLQQILSLRNCDVHPNPVVLDRDMLRDTGALQPGENAGEGALGRLQHPFDLVGVHVLAICGVVRSADLNDLLLKGGNVLLREVDAHGQSVFWVHSHGGKLSPSLRDHDDLFENLIFGRRKTDGGTGEGKDCQCREDTRVHGCIARGYCQLTKQEFNPASAPKGDLGMGFGIYMNAADWRAIAAIG